MKSSREYETEFFKTLQELSGEDSKYKGRISANMTTLKGRAADLEKKIDTLTEEAIGAELAGDPAKAEKARKDAATASVDLEQLQREMKALSRASTPVKLFEKLASNLWNAAKLAHKAFMVEEMQRISRRETLEKEIEERQRELEQLIPNMYTRGPSESLAHSLWQPEVRSFIFGVVAPEHTPPDEMSEKNADWGAWVAAMLIRGEKWPPAPQEEQKPEGVPYVDPWANGGPREIHYDGNGNPYSIEPNRRSATSIPQSVKDIKEGNY